MTRTTRNLYTEIRERGMRPGQWPALAFLLGLGMIGVALGSDLIGLGDGSGMGPKQFGLLAAGALVAVGGASVDLLSGRRVLPGWVRSLDMTRATAVRFVVVTAQFGLLLLIAQEYSLENQAFYNNILVLAFFGFIIHYFLPMTYRLPFFLLLSIGGISGVLGLVNAAWLIGIGLILIVISHLPIQFKWRIILLLFTGGGLALMRADVIKTPWLGAVWPILGSMFMFRLIIYLYDIRHAKGKISISRSLSYFFMLPNVVFPFFPIVDYSAYRRNYYDDEQHQIYQKGIEFMFLGIFQLILYRYINYYLAISPGQVENTGDLIRYLVSNFILYFRISGQFHLIIGMMHMFGFNLPEANRHYFLSSSFTDLWRRMNIYWKDFMMKVFYYPIYFRLRKMGPMKSIGLATVSVFVITWALHSYQWFWLRGSVLFSQTDMVFWTILGSLVVGNSLYEAKYGRKRSLSKGAWSVKETGLLAVRILGTFTVMSLLWALWTSPSISDWWSLMSVAGRGIQPETGTLSAFLLVGLLYEGSYRLRNPRSAGGRLGKTKKPPWFFKSVGITAVLSGFLYLVGSPAVYTHFSDNTRAIVADLRVTRLNDQDAELLERGYYENLNDVNGFNSQLWEIYMKRPDDWPSLWDTEAVRETNDFLKGEHEPLVGMVFRGQPYHTNRWGMRDQDYELIPRPGTFRIALVGSSHLEGWGVADGENFESLLETRINKENPGTTYAKYELLNFGMGAYTPLQELMQLETKVLDFQPDALIYIAHPGEASRSIRHLGERVRAGVSIPYPFLQDIVSETGISQHSTEIDTTRELTPYGDDIIIWIYQQFEEISKHKNIPIIWVYLPGVPGIDEPEEVIKLTKMAEEAGFIVLNLDDVYDGHDRLSIRVAEWDLHPNAAGHKLLAERLYQELAQQTNWIK